MICVLDTNVIVNSINNNLDCHSIMILFYVNRELKIGIDYNGKILKEYHDNCSRDEFFRKWYQELQNKGQIEYRDGKLDSAIKISLKNLGFHEEEDTFFVAVALNSDKNLITEDSDYGKGNSEKAEKNQKILEFMKKNLNLNIMNYCEGLDFLKNL
ncbi:MAG: hypothetical protein A2Y41_12725 [Spirochaetes bacterium GWB1_36_13]|nr:MAG: hypothetical protein A2Y41_12725 [Spirochaetes bacterium GWB1_36_13]